MVSPPNTAASNSSTNNLFINHADRPTSKDSGVMNLGKHCHKCQQLDFLPFYCEFCKFTYCSQHRTIDAHACPQRDSFENASRPVSISPEPTATAQSLFPDREKDKAKINQLINDAKPKPTNILEKQFRLGDVAAQTPNAFNKFAKFLNLQKLKRQNTQSSSSFGKLFKSTKLSGSSTKNRIVEVSTLKKTAKGDAKVPVGDRVFIWCLFIDANSTKSEHDEEEQRLRFTQINVDKDRKPVFVSSKWPVGRALDSIADTLHIRNYNNSTRDSSARLNIFMVQHQNQHKSKPQEQSGDDDELPVLVENSERVKQAWNNGDTIYLVKGSLT